MMVSCATQTVPQPHAVKWGKFIEVWYYSEYRCCTSPFEIEIVEVSRKADRVFKKVCFRHCEMGEVIVGRFLYGNQRVTTTFASQLVFTMEFKTEENKDVPFQVLNCLIFPPLMRVLRL